MSDYYYDNPYRRYSAWQWQQDIYLKQAQAAAEAQKERLRRQAAQTAGEPAKPLGVDLYRNRLEVLRARAFAARDADEAQRHIEDLSHAVMLFVEELEADGRVTLPKDEVLSIIRNKLHACYAQRANGGSHHDSRGGAG